MKTIYFDKDIPRVVATKAAAHFRGTRGLLFTGINAVKFKKDLPDPPLQRPPLSARRLCRHCLQGH